MANYATNIFHASTENKQDLDKIEAFLDDNFNGFVNRYGDTVDAEFSSRWEYPEKELEGLLEINKIINGFTSESFSLHKGESKRIKANGILVICSQYYNLYPSIAVISPATKNIEYIGGYKEYIDGTLFTFTFENDYTTIMTSKIEGVEGSRVPFLIAYQNLLP